MPDTRITKQKFKDHMEYSKKSYIFGILAIIAVASLLFTVTAPAIPNEKAVEVALCDAYVAPDKITEEDIAVLLQATQEFDEECEKVAFMSLAYAGDGTTEDGYYGAQVYMVQTTAGDNDLYFQNETMRDTFVKNGYALPLEELSFFDIFTEEHPEVAQYWAVEPPKHDGTEDEDEEEEAEIPENAKQHCYALDISAMTGLINRGCYDVRGKWASVIITSKNPDTALYSLYEMYNVFGAGEQ